MIKDRRLFDETGESRQEAPKPGEASAEEAAPPKQEAPSAEAETGQAHFPEPTFANFVLSLSTTAIFHFGDYPDPVGNQAEKNLPAAQHTIDLLSMLKTKTEGNLSAEERKLLDTILYELRMRYVQETAKK